MARLPVAINKEPKLKIDAYRHPDLNANGKNAQSIGGWQIAVKASSSSL